MPSQGAPSWASALCSIEARLSSLSHSGFANNLTISDAAFEDILNIAKENMKVSVPVYSVEGVVVGEYSFVRF